MKSKKAAIEMSIGMIITVILGVTLLIGGIFFVQRILSSSTGVIDLTDQQLRNEINKLFSEESKVSVYPGTRFVEIKQGVTDGVGIGIKNLLTGASGNKQFSYEVVISDTELQDKCGISAATAEDWIVTGKAEENIPIPSGDFSTQKVLFEIPVGSPLCTMRFRVNVYADGTPYATDFFDLRVKAK